jgi:hypothetical protein
VQVKGLLERERDGEGEGEGEREGERVIRVMRVI